MKVLQEFISSSRNGKIFLQLSMKTETKNLPFLLIFGYSDKATKGRHKKKLVFFRKTLKGGEGGLAESKKNLSEKTEILLRMSDGILCRLGVNLWL